MSGGCLEGVWRLWGCYPGDVRRLSGGGAEAPWRVWVGYWVGLGLSTGCGEAVWMVWGLSRGCGESPEECEEAIRGVWRLFEGRLFGGCKKAVFRMWGGCGEAVWRVKQGCQQGVGRLLNV